MIQIRFILVAAVFCCIAYAQNEPFALGADISWIPQREAGGVKYADNGQVKDIFEILKEHKFNYIRLRLFVDPTAKIPNESESPYSTAGYCGLNSTISMAKRVKAAGMKFLLDFHYSDTWADPGKQYKPMSWQDLTTLSQLSAKVRSYTKETLETFKAQGVLPDMVQIGNETVSGMIWDVGKNYSPGSWSNFATLVNAGIDGVRDVDANIKIMVHTINEKNPQSWLTSLKNAGATRIDVIGLSYYTQWHGQPDSLQRVVTRIATAHPEVKIAVAEYSGNHRTVNDIIFNIPNNKGFGTFVWEPADWEDEDKNGKKYGNVLFDWKNNRRETNTLIDLYPQMAIDYAVSSSSVRSSSSVMPSSSSSGAVSSSSSDSGSTPILPQIAASYATAQISVQSATGNVIVLENLPSNAKVEVYSLRGERVYASISSAGTRLAVPISTKGVYIVKISTP
ncbi:MAG: glycosyl hydrolase 53 family protein [Fibromonadaceae bacterium]|jgi:arabinogalactan endo-1,4-beta-galactosidase|nr:glycosyl hydrolase 53 family protein [Fibromonadaceae bacterium]